MIYESARMIWALISVAKQAKQLVVFPLLTLEKALDAKQLLKRLGSRAMPKLLNAVFVSLSFSVREL